MNITTTSPSFQTASHRTVQPSQKHVRTVPRQMPLAEDTNALKFGKRQRGATQRLGLKLAAGILGLGGLAGLGTGAYAHAVTGPNASEAVKTAERNLDKTDKQLDKLTASQQKLEKFLKRYTKTPFRYETDPRDGKASSETKIMSAMLQQVLQGRPDILAALNQFKPEGYQLQVRYVESLGKFDGGKKSAVGYQYCNYSPSIELASKSINPSDNFIHEFGHFLDCLDISQTDVYIAGSDSHLPGLTPEDIAAYDAERARLIENIKHKKSNIWDYAAFNQNPEFPSYADFLAVTLEYFFTGSRILHTESPVLWDIYSRYFNVDMPVEPKDAEQLTAFNPSDQQYLKDLQKQLAKHPDEQLLPVPGSNTDMNTFISGLHLQYETDENTGGTVLKDRYPRAFELMRDYEPLANKDLPRDPVTKLPKFVTIAPIDPETGLFKPGTMKQILDKKRRFDEGLKTAQTLEDQQKKQEQAVKDAKKERPSDIKLYFIPGVGIVAVITAAPIGIASRRPRYQAPPRREAPRSFAPPTEDDDDSSQWL